MDRKLRRAVYFLFISLLSLFFVACAKTVEKDIDEQIGNNLIMMSDNLISQITSLDDEAIDRNIKDLEEKKQFELMTALENWKAGKKDIGEVQAIKSDEAILNVDKEGYSVSISIVGEKRSAIVRIAYDKNMQKVNSMSINVNYNLGEKLSKAGLNTLIGMATVFIILIFIIFIIDAFKYISVFEEKLAKKPGELTKEEIKLKEEVSTQENLLEDQELVAVISAAIMAYEEENNTDDLIVRSLKKSKRRQRF